MPSLLQPDNNNERNPSGNEDILMRRQVVRYAIHSLEQMLNVQIVKAGGPTFNSTPSEADISGSGINMTQAPVALHGTSQLKYRDPLTSNIYNNLTPVQPNPEDSLDQSESIEFAREQIEEIRREEQEQ